MIAKRIFFLMIILCQRSVAITDINKVKGIVQYLKIWTDSRCEEDHIADVATSGNITLPNRSYYYFKVNGLWGLQYCNTNGNCLTRQVLNDFDGFNKCIRISVIYSGDPLFKIQRYGDPHQIEHSLHLFPLPNLIGNEVIVTENMNIPSMSVGSYFFSGLGSWTLYGSPNFEGETHCREPRDKVTSEEYGFTYFEYASFSVASASQGCVDLQPPSTTTPKPIDGNCTRPGIYFVPYNGDCRKFMMCHKGQLLPEVHECPEGTLFDEDFGDCNLEAAVECKPSCPAQGTLTFPHYRNCSLYWLCIFGDRILRQCAPGLQFDSSSGQCNLGELVLCPNTCPSEGSINLPHSGDCKLYWACLSGTPTLSRCEPGFVFNSSKGHCYPDDMVECGTQTLQKSVFKLL